MAPLRCVHVEAPGLSIGSVQIRKLPRPHSSASPADARDAARDASVAEQFDGHRLQSMGLVPAATCSGPTEGLQVRWEFSKIFKIFFAGPSIREICKSENHCQTNQTNCEKLQVLVFAIKHFWGNHRGLSINIVPICTYTSHPIAIIHRENRETTSQNNGIFTAR